MAKNPLSRIILPGKGYMLTHHMKSPKEGMKDGPRGDSVLLVEGERREHRKKMLGGAR
jgi:hypothetical protein